MELEDCLRDLAGSENGFKKAMFAGGRQQQQQQHPSLHSEMAPGMRPVQAHYSIDGLLAGSTVQTSEMRPLPLLDGNATLYIDGPASLASTQAGTCVRRRGRQRRVIRS